MSKHDEPDWQADLPRSVRKHIEHLHRMRRDFVANVSHELRTPLTVIHGYLEMLEQQAKDNPDLPQTIYAQMLQQSHRMHHIIEDLLMLSRIESDEYLPTNMETINMAGIIEDVAHASQSLLEKKHHTLAMECDTSLTIQGVYSECHSVVSNLLTNAIKYTPDTGYISVTWQAEGQQAVLTVQDNGIGIAEKHLPRLTERFYRVDKARSREHGGTGLGLAIVKHILIHHNASLSIDSEVGQGTTFKCVFTHKSDD